MSAATTSPPVTHELVRFVLARVGEDEAVLKRLARSEAAQPEADRADDGGLRSISRLRAEAAAKRRLLGSLQHLLVLRDQPAEKMVRDQAAQMLRTLALPYEAHAAFRSEWRG
jgi:hypothetical protein